jgi:hypothetical protein
MGHNRAGFAKFFGNPPLRESDFLRKPLGLAARDEFSTETARD